MKRNGGATGVGAVRPRQGNKGLVKLTACVSHDCITWHRAGNHVKFEGQPCGLPVYIRATDTADWHGDSGRENRDVETVMSE